MKRINRYLFNNLIWKILSVCLAALLWLVCVNVVNPIVLKTFTNTLVIRNLDIVESNGYILINEEELKNQIVVMRVRAVNDSFPQVGNSFFTPYIDVSPIDYLTDENIGAAQQINIYVDHLGNTGLSDFNPVSIETNPVRADIILDKIIEADYPVTVNVTGVPLDEYVPLPGQASPESVTVKGPSAIIDTISSVYVEANIGGAYEDVRQNQAPRIIDAEKRDITSKLSLSANLIEINVPINMYAKVPIRQNVIGRAEIGYEMVSVSMSVDYIEVVGAPEDIKTIPYIILPDIDISGFTQTRSISFDARPGLIDTSLSIVNGTPNEVVASITIEKQIEKEIPYSATLIKINNKAPDIGEVILPDELTISVQGLKSRIDGFDQDKIIEASIDITDLAPGTHIVPVSFIMPMGVYLAEDVALEIMLMAKSP